MIHGQATKEVMVITPQSIGTTEVTGTFDTLDYEYAEIKFIMDTAATNEPPTTMSLGEGEATNSFTAIQTFEGGDTTYGFTIPTPNTSTGDIVKYCVALPNRKRYLQVGLANTAPRICAVTATLSRAKQAPNTDAEAGCAAIVYG